MLDELDQSTVISKQRLEPGRMLVVDTQAGRIIADEEIKQQIATEKPYADWIKQYTVTLEELPEPGSFPRPDHDTLIQRQKAFGYTYEDVRKTILPMARDGIDPLGAMVPMRRWPCCQKAAATLQLFQAAVCPGHHPPIDAIREEIVTSSLTALGGEAI
ncbi:MAG: glutamate synthase central domain-containing protein [Thiolinea sp.]